MGLVLNCDVNFPLQHVSFTWWHISTLLTFLLVFFHRFILFSLFVLFPSPNLIFVLCLFPWILWQAAAHIIAEVVNTLYIWQLSVRGNLLREINQHAQFHCARCIVDAFGLFKTLWLGANENALYFHRARVDYMWLAGEPEVIFNSVNPSPCISANAATVW